MPVLAIDLGGTKLALAVFSEDGILMREERIQLENRGGESVGELIIAQIEKHLSSDKDQSLSINAIGISVPGISYQSKGTVWAPNIKGWEAYPLLHQVQEVAGTIPINIDSDRTCYILGEMWQGAARGCSDAVYLAVGTGIGAGILSGGNILRGANDIAGAIGWMAFDRPFNPDYQSCGCYESQASGEGIGLKTRAILKQSESYNGLLRDKPIETITAHDVFHAYEYNDPIAKKVVENCIELWGMSIANLVSILNPQKIILGGGVFGPAVRFIDAIHDEAMKWGQPVSMKHVSIEASLLGNNAGLYGAGFSALQKTKAS